MSHGSVLVVEDDESLREALIDTLRLAGYSVLQAADGSAAIDILNDEMVGMIVSDVQMEGMDGHALLKQVKKQYFGLPFVLMTAYGTIQKAVEAMQDGAVDYLVKPFESEVLVNMISRYLPDEFEPEGEIIAEDQKTKEVLALVKKVADSEATVLISGESGTGKEVIAKEIHRASARSNGPFIALNCAAIPENMLEAMLFGYEKGAFTGAYKSSPGKFELANLGTLLLDEISEMDVGLQAKLLRVLQEREVERLGGNKLISLDVRVLATTNRNMKKEVAEGKFREDLYYRLNVFPVFLPPLRERPGDVIPLFNAMLGRHIKGTGKPTPMINKNVEQKLRQHQWPGNVRELDNVAQRSLILTNTHAITEEHIMFEPELELSGSTERSLTGEVSMNVSDSLGDSLKTREYRLILDALQETHGSRKKAAETLGVSQRTLRYKLARMRDEGMEIPSAYGAA